MRCDLEDAIGRSITDRPTSAHVFFAMRVDDRHARCVAIAQGTIRSREHTDLVEQALSGRLDQRRGSNASPTAPARQPVPNGQMACPCRAISRSRPPKARWRGVKSGGFSTRGQPNRCPQPQIVEIGHSQTARTDPPLPCPCAQACAIWASVFDPVSGWSPLKNDAASGAPPQPTESITTRKARGISQPSDKPLAAHPVLFRQLYRPRARPPRPLPRRSVLRHGSSKAACPPRLGHPARPHPTARPKDQSGRRPFSRPPPRCTTARPSASPSIPVT